MITTIYSDPDFLEHHGVKGMKWGVRRYQNYDGSLKRKPGFPGPINKTDMRQRKFADSIAKSRSSSEVKDKVNSALSDKDISELKSLWQNAQELSKNIDWDKQWALEDEYEAEYTNRAIDWSIKETKKYSMEGWKQIEKDAKDGGFDVRDHKAIRYGADGYSEIEPYNPPRSKDVQAYHDAIDKYCDKSRECTSKLLGQYSHVVVDKEFQNYGGAAGDWVDSHVWKAIGSIVEEDRR